MGLCLVWVCASAPSGLSVQLWVGPAGESLPICVSRRAQCGSRGACLPSRSVTYYLPRTVRPWAATICGTCASTVLPIQDHVECNFSPAISCKSRLYNSFSGRPPKKGLLGKRASLRNRKKITPSTWPLAYPELLLPFISFPHCVLCDFTPLSSL